MRRGISSAGRAPALQAGGRRFDPVILHHRSCPSKAAAAKAHRHNRPVLDTRCLVLPCWSFKTYGCSLTIHRVESAVPLGAEGFAPLGARLPWCGAVHCERFASKHTFNGFRPLCPARARRSRVEDGERVSSVHGSGWRCAA